MKAPPTTPEPRHEPTPGRYQVFHHVYGAKAPTLYMTDRAPDIRGAFVRLLTSDGEVWLSGNLTIRPIK